MEWLIIGIGTGFILYLLYCYFREWRDKRRFERIRKESREKARLKSEEEASTKTPGESALF